MLSTCEAFPQNREQVTFWVEKSFFGICKEHTFSFNLIPKSSSYSYFMRYDHLCIRPFKQFLWKCAIEKIGLYSFLSYSFGFDRLQKIQNFSAGNVLRSVRNYMKDILMYIKKTKNLKIGLRDLFPVLSECITYKPAL